MKRILSLILMLFFLCGLSGCHYNDGGDILDAVQFYYPRKTTNFLYGSPEGVIAPETREASGHVDDLNYLLAMYLRGPQDESLRSPFPAGCKLENVHAEDRTLYVRLSGEFTALENAELTIACASLAKTFLASTDYDHICIDADSGEKAIHMTLDENSMLFADQVIPESPEGTGAPQ